MTKVVGFDLDDTIVPEVLFLKSGVRHIASRLVEKYPELSFRCIVSGMDTAIFTRRNHYSALENLLKETGLYERVNMKEIVDEFRSHKPDKEIYHAAPSMTEVLEKLKKEGTPLVLITDGRSSTQRNKIEAAGLYRYFENDDIYISEERGVDKNHPDSFLNVMDRYAGAEEFHFVGDNPPKDFLHPLKLGWKVHPVHSFPLAIHQGLP